MRRSLIAITSIAIINLLAGPLVPAFSQSSAVAEYRLHVIPYPRHVDMGGEPFPVPQQITIVSDKDASREDHFAAEELAHSLQQEFGVRAAVSTTPSQRSITLTRKNAGKRIGAEGYQLIVSPDGIVVRSHESAGLFYGTQTLLQLIEKGSNGYQVPALKITDWPDVTQRAVHYDTKHHQDKKEYVRSFIRDLARYKINMLVWEWEDKLAYNSHPEIGAPGAFSITDMQEFAAYARQYHVELVPLVQGLGHVSFILKWPQFAHLREISSSNWEFCPLKSGAYDLLFDLWDEAISATPGSRYIHVGSDETYELGACEACQAKSREIGKSGLYTLFINKAADYLKSRGREVMAWERPMGWVQSASPAIGLKPEKNIILTESYEYEEPDFRFARQAKAQGYKVFAYDPNPGIEHIFLPYYFREHGGERVAGSLQESHDFLTSNTQSGAFDGIISTSWDDSGLHNQVWMLRFATAAAFSWNGKGPSLDQFRNTFFKSYYGHSEKNMDELFQLLNEAAYYYMQTFERRVWHHGMIGKTHLPDVPRGDALEYDPYWNSEYSEMIDRSEEIIPKMERALAIIDSNKSLVRKPYDLEVFRSIARLVWHTALTYKDLADLENLITQAHKSHFESHQRAHNHLEQAVTLVEKSLKRREVIFNDLVSTWEETRLPKGMSTSDKKYFFRQDRARHFANRVPDMTYLIYDEQKLNIEEYLSKLRTYVRYYEKTYLPSR